MPYTINGIGTHYYGAKNRSARVDVCTQCGRSATLTSYDTREWFCFVFIPVIPLGKYRILNQCSSCRRHQRMKTADFQSELEAAVAPLREAIRRSPRDPEPYVALVQTLTAWEMRAEAEKELEAATALFPGNVDIMLQAASMAVDRGDWQRAHPLYERAYAADSQNPTATYGFGWILHQLGRHEEALPVLHRAAAQEENRLGALYLLGNSQKELGRWNEALATYQKLQSLEPGYAQDKTFLRLIAECKRHLGYQLTDAERRAGRSWWPFGKKKKNEQPVLQAHAGTVRPSLRYALVAIAGLMIVGGAFAAYDEKTSIDVWFDNSLERGVQVELDGKRFELPPNTPHQETVKKGPHTIVVRDGGRELERHSVTLEEQGLFDALTHDRFFVYNVAGQGVYRRSRHGYAQNEQDASYEEQLVAMERFFEQRDVDYVFQTPPDTLSIDSRSSKVVKVAFNIARDVDLATYAMMRLDEGDAATAKTAADRAAANRPCNTDTRRAQVYVASLVSGVDEASQVARRWIGDCAEDDVEAHRMYQDINSNHHGEAGLREEYRKLVGAAPQSAKLHYLYGRVADDPAVAAAEHQEALRLDPKLIWPRVALGHVYAEEARYDDALREFGIALDTPGRDPDVAVYYAMAAVGKGRPEEAVAKIDAIYNAHPDDYPSLSARWILALAAKDWDGATTVQQKIARLEPPSMVWFREVQRMRMKDDLAVELKIGGALRSDELRASAVQVQTQHLLTKHQFAEAAEFLAKEGKDLEPRLLSPLQSYIAAGLMLQGNGAAAAPLLDEAEKNAKESRLLVALAQGLKGTIPVETAFTIAREQNASEHGWFVRAVRAAVAKDRARAAESFRRTVLAASDLSFPYLEAKAMAALVQ